ncbi:MAG TPA: ATP-dependent 6-phosphofructokinase [Acidobacteriota bacterium]|nr:ATP-dependent 6-phosphofructokinase [Acidobacteriota bacterium]
MSESSGKKIALLTGGGDCPGLNAVIRAVVKTAILKYDWEVYGSEDSFAGFLERGLTAMALKHVRGILPLGGTILGTSNKGNPFRYPVRGSEGEVEFHDYSGKVVETFHEHGLDAVVMIGGDGTLTIGHKLQHAGVPVIGVPKTIDNDVKGTELTFGFDSALHTATDAIDKLHTTAQSHDRVMLVEVMGRNAGWIALESGIAGGADVILIPEIPFTIPSICRKIMHRRNHGRDFSIVVVAEGAAPQDGEQVFRAQPADDPFGKLGGISYKVANEIQRCIDIETRSVVLGHLQRGGSPTPFDRLLGTRYGRHAVDLIAQEQFGRMVNLRCGCIDSIPLQDAIGGQRLVDPDDDRVRTARALGISFGDEPAA